MSDSPAALIELILKRQDFIAKQEQRFSDLMKPYREQLEIARLQLHAYLLDAKLPSIRSEYGTAYLSTIVTPKVEDKIAFLDWVMEDWDSRGAMLNIGKPYQAGLQEYQDANEGKLPPYVTTSSILRLNVKP